MSLDDKTVRELEQWRSKYYDSLAQLEHKEKEWRHTDNVLRQCISRLTLAADNDDREFQQQLGRVREAIRAQASGPQLEGLIQSLSHQLLRLDKERRTHVAPPNPFDVMHQLVNGINLPRGMGHKAKALAKGLAGQPSDADYKPKLQELISLIGEAIDWAANVATDDEASAPKGSLLGKLFNKRNGEPVAAQAVVDSEPSPLPFPAAKTPSASPPPGNAELDLDLAKGLLSQFVSSVVAPAGTDLGGVARQISSAHREEELRRLTLELAALLSAQKGEAPVVPLPAGGALSPQEVLLQLLERLAVPAELNDKVEAIKERLGGPLQPGDLEQVLGSIADLITAMRARVQSEKAEIEAFLQQLTANLQELDQNLQNAVNAHRETVREGRNLDANVQEQVRGIEQSVQQAQDLDQLKSAVQSRVDTIRRHMDIFRRTEDERIESAEQEVARLNDRLRNLESETDMLRGRIQQERRQALVDPLTEIFNRLAYNERIAQEFARWKRYQAPLVFTVWDVDNFKRINDTYGHQAGDKVLKVVAKLLSTQVRETDFVARYGGEEFVILLPETELAGARIVTEKVRAAIEKCEFHYRGERVLITISCGLAQFHEDDDPDTVFARADAALYRAKAAGRNRCISESEE